MASLKILFLAVLVLLAMTLQATEAGPYGANVEDSVCCRDYFRHPLPSRMLKYFYWTSDSCRRPGVVSCEDHNYYPHFTDVETKGRANNGRAGPEDLAPKFMLLALFQGNISHDHETLGHSISWPDLALKPRRRVQEILAALLPSPRLRTSLRSGTGRSVLTPGCPG
ncbi:C-C motif chemokine 22 isoform X1 [Acinonyx jubatus]|uniref:C-C motif chemokine 22 isoform X1 n=1 Tax=Acinonyx jubatus TaxID=32536 RepID=A0ABM3P452_ACIJB|nr:C-C motif chemokine 22 isoform X1 [Acinonyx jubatus]